MKRRYGASDLMVLQPKKVSRSYVAVAKSRKRGYYSTAEQRRAAYQGMPGLLGDMPRVIAPGYTSATGFYGRFNGPGRELKFLDTESSFSIDRTGEVPATGQLVLIPQGATQSTRIGFKCTIRSIQWRAVVEMVPDASVNSSGVAYIYLIQDTQANGAAAAVTDVFTSASLEKGLLNIANASRFRILKKWVLDFNSQAGVTTAYNSHARHVEYFKKCNIPLDFNGATGAITEIRSNNLFIIAGSALANSDDEISVFGSFRVRFDDN